MNSSSTNNGISSKKDDASSSFSTKVLEFNVGIKAKREVRKTFHETKVDPISTIIEFQRQHSLHTMIAKAFDTIPVYCTSEKNTTNVEPFQPDPVVTFLSHLGATHQEIHKRILEALRSHLLEEVERSTNNDALLELLKHSWAVSNLGASELRPVLVAILKKLHDDTPQSVLLTMASRDETKGELKYGELLSELPLRMRRLVWEADAAATNSSSSSPSSSLIQTILQPFIQEYETCSEPLKYAANLTFGIGISERRMATAQVRRRQSTNKASGVSSVAGSSSTSIVTLPAIPTNSTSTSTTGILSTLSSRTTTTTTTTITNDISSNTNIGKSATAKDAVPGTTSSTNNHNNTLTALGTPGDAITKIREIIGDRPKLFHTLVQMLIAQHGTTTTTTQSLVCGTDQTILGGERYLHCCLLSDILLTFGSSCMSKSYEHVCVLARIVDECVTSGTIEESHIVQIQGCLRHIFEVPLTSTTTIIGQQKGTTTTTTTSPNATKPPPPKSIQKGNLVKPAVAAAAAVKATTKVVDKNLQKAISVAIIQMKLDDREGIFLNPVTDENVPGYSDVIHEPMCVSMMEEKVANGKYLQLTEFERDVKLMFQNCITFNNGKDGQWFRNEARRQHKAFREFTLKKAKEELKRLQRSQPKSEINKIQPNPDSSNTIRKRKSPMASILGSASTSKATLQLAAGTATSEKSTLATTAIRPPTAVIRHQHHIEIKDTIEPLPFMKSKKRKKDIDGPSMPAIASMILTDPFLIRLLLHKLYRRLHETLPSQKKIPCGDKIVPSILQLLRIAQSSSQICASKGKRYVVPDVGIEETDVSSEEQAESSSFLPLRKFMPLLTKLFVDAELDRRFVIGGDLYDIAEQVSGMKVLAPSGTEEDWSKASPSSRVILRSIVQGALVHLLQPGNSNEMALKAQLPRFVDVLNWLAASHPQDLFDDRPFFLSMAHGLLRFKARLPHSIRDLVIRLWLGWLRGGGSVGMGRVRTMTCPLHELFIHLLNEWAKLGNAVMPRDKLLGLAEEAGKAVEQCEPDSKNAFGTYWLGNDKEFASVKAQYQRMLHSVPEDRAAEWRCIMGIEKVSVSLTESEVGEKQPVDS